MKYRAEGRVNNLIILHVNFWVQNSYLLRRNWWMTELWPLQLGLFLEPFSSVLRKEIIFEMLIIVLVYLFDDNWLSLAYYIILYFAAI